MFHRRGNKRDLREIISKASNFKERAKFPSRVKTMFHESFQGSRKQFQSKRLVMLRTDVYVTADLYQAKRRYKINMLMLVAGRGAELPYERGRDARRLA